MWTADINLVAMFFYDETELKEYIQKNEDDKLVVALAYLDNYEEALEGVEDVQTFSSDRTDRPKDHQIFFQFRRTCDASWRGTNIS